MNALGELWTYRPCSDIASKVSSDGSSFVSPYFAHMSYQSDEEDIEIQLLLDQQQEEEDSTTVDTERSDEDNDTVWDKELQDLVAATRQKNTTTIVEYEQRQDTNTIAGWRSASTASCNNQQPRLPTKIRLRRHKRPCRLQKAATVGNETTNEEEEDRSSMSRSLFAWNFCPWDFSSAETCSNDSNTTTNSQHSKITQRSRKKGKGTVKVVVEATAICDLDLLMHPPAASPLDSCQAFWWDQDSTIVKGSNFVGVVHQCSHPHSAANDHGIATGSRVAAIVPGGSRARYVNLPPHRLFCVPKHLDSSDICAVLSTYLPAFAALHHGRQRPYRYSRSCFQGRKILVAGCTSLEAQAAVHLAAMAGATDIYVTAPREYHCVLQKHRPIVLGPNVDEWLLEDTVKGKMDVVLDYQFPQHFQAVQAALAPKGRLVCIAGRRQTGRPQWTESDQLQLSWCCTSLEHHIAEYCALATMKRATLFSFADTVEFSFEEVQQDLEFLLKLLSTRQLRPDIDRFIGLNEVVKAHGDICRRPLYGSIICEPWKDC